MNHLLGLALVASTWQDPLVIGKMNDSLLPEASGIAASPQYADRLYHINDSGNDPAFVVTTQKGQDMQLVNISGIDTTDTEDLTIGSCPDQGSCLYIADVGDNDAERSSVNLYAIRERAEYPDEVPVDFTLRLHFPDGAHNVESVALHPSGVVFLLTKEDPAVLYRFPLPKIKAGDKAEVNLSLVGSLKLSPYLPGAKSKSLLPTSMDIRADGQALAILCAAGIVVLEGNLVDGLNGLRASKLPYMTLPQAEAITWLPDGGILYTTESNKSLKGQVPLVYIGKH